jgi:hypothetical protein
MGREGIEPSTLRLRTGLLLPAVGASDPLQYTKPHLASFVVGGCFWNFC